MESLSDFHKKIHTWFTKHGKKYPWRETHDPYAILVSEIMLQQTRVTAVLEKNYYTNFLNLFPNIKTLAEAKETEVIKSWEGLGYYRRARMLQATAQTILKNHQGIFPHSDEALQKLPGIGKYTAGAIRSFAFNQPAPIVDGNIFRVIARLYNDFTPIDSTQGVRLTWLRAEKLLNRKNPRLHNSALMELGQQICKVGTPLCTLCPVASFCLAKNPEQLPVKEKKVMLTPVTEHALLIVNEQNEILLDEDPKGRRKGLWQLPLITEKDAGNHELLFTSLYTITRYKVTLHTYRANHSQLQCRGTWFPLKHINQISISAPFKKVLRKLLEKNHHTSPANLK